MGKDQYILARKVGSNIYDPEEFEIGYFRKYYELSKAITKDKNAYFPDLLPITAEDLEKIYRKEEIPWRRKVLKETINKINVIKSTFTDYEILYEEIS